MALLIHESDCHHHSCEGEHHGAPGRMSPQNWCCDCPCHSLTGEEREAWIKAHPTKLEQMCNEAMDKLRRTEGTAK